MKVKFKRLRQVYWLRNSMADLGGAKRGLKGDQRYIRLPNQWTAFVHETIGLFILVDDSPLKKLDKQIPSQLKTNHG